MSKIDRRTFLAGAAAGVGTMLPAGRLLAKLLAAPAPFRGMRTILIRFGGGVRRQETIDPEHTYSPFFFHELIKRGVFFKNMEIAQIKDVQTGHGEGTLNLLTGTFDTYKDVGGKFLGERFEAKVPTIFEYLRGTFEVPEHQTLIINGEDRTDEEFYSFSNHHLYGVRYRCNVLSLYRFKAYLLEQQVADWKGAGKELDKKKEELAKLQALDHRVGEEARSQGPEIKKFWERWRRHYGESGFVNPRGDRLLTELAIRVLHEIRPKLMMINYQDPDYVHWGNKTHYTRGISTIDEGIRRIVDAVEADEEYRGNTLFIIAPDCGRDYNPYVPVPYQHHFGDRSAHEIFALFFGPGVPTNQVVDRTVQQIDVAPTIGQLMGFKTPFAEGKVLPEAIS